MRKNPNYLPMGASRRAYLLSVVGGLSSLAGCQDGDGPGDGSRVTETPDGGTQPRTPTPEPSMVERFDRVVDVVEDAGCDPDGRSPCTSALREYLRDDTLFVFPPGTYRFDGRLQTYGLNRVGFVGRDRPRLIPPDGFNEKLIDVMAGEILFRNFDVDVRTSETTASLRLIGDSNLQLDTVRFLGRGDHPAESVEFATYLAVRDRDGTGVVDSLVAKKGSILGNYKSGDGRGGMWIGNHHQGTMRIENCHLEEFGNNGIYASRCPGNVEVRDSYFRNNSPSSVRIGGQGSFVENSSFVANLDVYTGPITVREEVEPRAIVIERGGLHKPPGAAVRDCEIRIENTPFAAPAIHLWPTGQTVTVRDTVIQADHDGSVIHRAGKKQQGAHPPADGPRWVDLSNVTIRGRGSGYTAVRLIDAPESRFTNCWIDLSGADHHGLWLTRSDGTTINGGLVQTPGYPIVITREGLVSDACLLHVANDPRLRLTDGQPCPAGTASSPYSPDDVPLGLCAQSFTKAMRRHQQESCIGAADEFLSEGDRWNQLALTEVGEDEIKGMLLSQP